MRVLSVVLCRSKALELIESSKHLMHVLRAHWFVATSASHCTFVLIRNCRHPKHLHVVLGASRAVAQQVVGSVDVQNLHILNTVSVQSVFRQSYCTIAIGRKHYLIILSSRFVFRLGMVSIRVVFQSCKIDQKRKWPS